MKIPLILITLFFAFNAAAFADTIYLNDGAIYTGEIINIDDNEVTIRTTESTFTINKYKIKKVERNKEENKKIEEEQPVGPGMPQWDSHWN
ncbi:MAG: hypothetical protein PHI59_09295 [Candidatus Omnitrophica bacterium]|nr:hypothetical protein [Candidatus Omnitrophota bacterium]